MALQNLMLTSSSTNSHQLPLYLDYNNRHPNIIRIKKHQHGFNVAIQSSIRNFLLILDLYVGNCFLT